MIDYCRIFMQKCVLFFLTSLYYIFQYIFNLFSFSNMHIKCIHACQINVKHLILYTYFFTGIVFKPDMLLISAIDYLEALI